MKETKNEKTTVENERDAIGSHSTDCHRYLAYQEAVKAMKEDADGGR